MRTYQFKSQREHERQKRAQRRAELINWAFWIGFAVLGFYALTAIFY